MKKTYTLSIDGTQERPLKAPKKGVKLSIRGRFFPHLLAAEMELLPDEERARCQRELDKNIW
jgi:hypothetical protein